MNTERNEPAQPASDSVGTRAFAVLGPFIVLAVIVGVVVIVGGLILLWTAFHDMQLTM